MSSRLRRLAVLSVHTSPLDQPGTGDGGGLNVYVREVGRRLAASGIHVDAFTRTTSPGAPPVVEVDDLFAVHHIDAGPRAPLPKEVLTNHLCAFLLGLEAHVERLGIDRRYDALHAHYWMSGWVGLALRQRWDVPLIQTFHTLAAVKNRALVPGEPPEPVLRVLAEQRLVARADRIVVPACGEARLLHRGFGASGGRLAVVAPGVDPDVFHPGESPDPPEAPPGSGPLLLFAGRLQPLKAPDVAVRTLALVRRQVRDARLLVVGGTSGNGAGRCGPDELRALAVGLGVADAVRIAPARPQPELALLYRAADVVLVPSRSESFGLVALEAQACGTPVVAAKVGGLEAVVGGGGTLVEGHHPSDHSAAVVAYLTDPARRAHAAAQGIRAAGHATWDHTVERLLSVYADVAGVTAAARGAGA
ncbi:MAG TPA: glycosyltransferase [Nitriliruptorales bacterium]|nr:glycosyltransferase [Nitriliruptorales bacterium]